MIPRLWRWWQGYVTVRFNGPGVERILNEMAGLKMVVFEIERLTPHVIILRLRHKDFRRLRPLVRGSQISASILDRHGAPFLVRRFRLRAFLVIGLLACLAFLTYLSNFIWFIEVIGNQSISVSSLKVAVEDSGLHIGVAKHSLQPRKVEAALMERFPELAWAKLSVKGVKLEVELVERDGLEIDYGGAGHIYAVRDGVITEILVLKGTPEVQEGDTVRSGDLLISGVHYDAQGKRTFGAAQGIIKGRVWYQGIGESALRIQEPVKTGRVRSQYSLTIGPIRFPLGRSYPPETHLRETREWNLPLGSAMVPLSWAKTKYHEVDFVARDIPHQEAERQAYDLAWESLIGQGVVEDNVLQKTESTEFMADAHGLRVTVHVEVLEDMGRFLSQ